MPRHTDVETSPPGVDPLVGTVFDKRFLIEERIAAGGFGAIYRAKHVKSGHEVAVKLLLPALAQDLGVVARFRREGAALTALRNPHTIAAYELGQAADHSLFIVMELLHGQTLFDRYRDNGPFEWRRMVKIAREVCESLDEAHALGIIHRDLKPTNIHLEHSGDDRDFVKVLDFGIAKILSGSGFDASDITNAGQMIGTLDYMSPEQMVGAAVTGQTDIYTLGLVIYEMIAGCTAFPEAQTASAALGAMLKTKPKALYLRAPVPEQLDQVVMRCLERETHRRYRTVAEVSEALAKLLGPVDRTDVVVAPKPRVDDDVPTIPPPAERVVVEKSPPRGPNPVVDWNAYEERATVREMRDEATLAEGLGEAATVLATVGEAATVAAKRNIAAAGAAKRNIAAAGAATQIGPAGAVKWSDAERDGGWAHDAATVEVRPLSSRPPPLAIEEPTPGGGSSSLAIELPTPLPGSGYPREMRVQSVPSIPRTPPQRGTPLPPGELPGPPLSDRAAFGPHVPLPYSAVQPPLAHGVNPQAFPHTPRPGSPSKPPHAGARRPTYDMGGMAAREAEIRRLIWAVALVVTGIVALVVATWL